MEEKLKRYPLWLILIIPCLLSSCISEPAPDLVLGPTVTYNPFATLSPTPFYPPAVSPSHSPSSTVIENTPTPGETPVPQTDTRSDYTLTAELDFLNHALRVNEGILYKNNTGRTLDRLVLAVEPNHWMGCFILDAATKDGDAVPYELLGHRLEIPLTPPLVPGAEVELSLEYRLNLPASDSHHLFGYKTEQINLVDWYPFIVPYADDWLLHNQGEVGEHLVYDAVDFDVSLIVAPPMVIAASAPLAEGRYHLENARTFAFSVSPKLESTTVDQDGIALTSYYFAPEKYSGEMTLHEVGYAFQLFGSLFMTYPHPSLSIVETDFYDGMEYDGLFFLGQDFYLANDGTKLNYMVALAVHETAHQWWFGLVGNDQALDPWLDEALATYSEYLFYEHFYPDIAPTWWQFRVDRFSPLGAVDSDIYISDAEQTYIHGVYLRGAQFFGDLRAAVGDESFFSFLEGYAAQMSGKVSTAGDFFRVLRQYTSVDVIEVQKPYFTTWH